MKPSTGIVPSPADVGKMTPEPSPDYDALYNRYIPENSADLSWDEFADRGIELIDGARQRFLVLGHLALWGWSRFCPDDTQRAWELKCAQAWGCNRSTINKAISLARSPILLPADTPPTLAYAVLSAAQGDAEKAEKIMTLALKEGWSAFDVRAINILVAEKLLSEYAKPRLIRLADRLDVRVGKKQVTVARFEDNGTLSKAGARWLELKGGF